MSSLRRKKVAHDEQHRRPPGSPEGQRTPDTGVTPARDLIPFREALRTWFAISLQTFGGPAGQIAVTKNESASRAAGITCIISADHLGA